MTNNLITFTIGMIRYNIKNLQNADWLTNPAKNPIS